MFSQEMDPHYVQGDSEHIQLVNKNMVRSNQIEPLDKSQEQEQE